MSIDYASFYSLQAQQEYKDFRIFHDFYESLAEKKDIYYMFFSTGLLQWVRKALQFIPPDMNVVLIGAGLVPAEKEWVSSQARRPAVYLERSYTDHTIWDFLFRVNRTHFGWIDIDCFVFNPQVLTDLTRVGDAVLSAAWTYRIDSEAIDKRGHKLQPEIANTYLLYVNMEAVNALRQHTDISPRPYLLSRSNEAVMHSRHRSLLDKSHEQLLQNLFQLPSFPPDIEPYPVESAIHSGVETRFIDTLVLFQLLAYYEGYRIQKLPVNRKDNRAVYHFGGASYYKNYIDPRYSFVSEGKHVQTAKYERALLMDYLLVSQGEDLPPPYQGMKRMLHAYLQHAAIKAAEAEAKLTDILRRSRLGEKEIELLLTANKR